MLKTMNELLILFTLMQSPSITDNDVENNAFAISRATPSLAVCETTLTIVEQYAPTNHYWCERSMFTDEYPGE